MNAWLKKDRNGNFTCGQCRELFKPNPNAVLDYSSPDSIGIDRVFCSSDCANEYMVADAEATAEMQNYKPEVDENGKVLI